MTTTASPTCAACGQALAERAAFCHACGHQAGAPVLRYEPKSQNAGREWRTRTELFGWPLVHVCYRTTDPETGKRKTARGVVAVGDRAVGVVAYGGVAYGLIAHGGVAVGGLAFGGAAAGVVALGGVAIGLIAALGGVAVGGLFALGGVGLSASHAYGGVAVAPNPTGGVTFRPW